MNLLSLLSARQAGEMRCGVASIASDDLPTALKKFGLSMPTDGLVELDLLQATELLTRLIEVDLVYGTTCVPHEDARRIAEGLLSEYASTGSRYFSNGDGTGSWMPLTKSTFDAGLIVRCQSHVYFCVWFEEED